MDSTGVVIAFWALSAVTIGAALAVLLARNLVHAIVFLILAFMGMAGLFVTLSADFIAVAQVLIYAGSISILLVFAVMLTPLARRDNANSLYLVPGVLAGIGVGAIVVFVSVRASWDQLSGAALGQRSFPDTVQTIGRLLVGRYVLAFEIASVLLLFALIGAILLVQDRGDEAAAGTAEDAPSARSPREEAA